MPTPALTVAQSLLALGVTPEMISTRGLQLCPEASELMLAETGDDGREHLLQPQAAASWRVMKQAAAQAGVPMHLVSAFRSVGRQTEILRNKLAAGQSIEDALRWVAPPGYSEHHSGCAIDIGAAGQPALEEDFETTPAFEWLQRHAGAHGFRLSYPRSNTSGYGYEPWHWYFHSGSSPA